MGTLTKKERDGLEDVFLSIHATTNRYEHIKRYLSIGILKPKKINFKKLFKVAKYGVKETKFQKKLLAFTKKKKNLSK